MGTELEQLLSVMFQAHPWHGVSPGDQSPTLVTAYIEIVPTDAVKYELDKQSGHLRIDRPQRYSSLCPTLYGFIPQTYCGDRLGRRCAERTRLTVTRGDGDPLDICVLTEKTIPAGNFLLRVRPIGGLRMVDGDEADDKLVAVLEGDVAYGHLEELAEVPTGVIDRLRHYFLSYKQLPGPSPRQVSIAEVYDRAEAHEVLRLSVEDYRDNFGAPESRVSRLQALLSKRG
jgi:inorganic pyrophosphatase